MTETYARDELERAAQDTRMAIALVEILDDLTGGMTWTREEIMESGNRLGYVNSASIIIARAQEMKSVTEIIDKARIANDDDVVTIGELRAWVARRATLSTTTIRKDTGIDEMAADIFAHREPDYPAGTVVRDAKDDWWHRTAGCTWEAPGVSGHVGNDVPARPLKIWYHP